MSSERPHWSWASDDDDATRFRAESQGILGEVLAEVRYIDIDYRSENFRGDAIGLRMIVNPDEWVAPTWVHEACDTVDFAVELVTESGRRFTASWESPGWVEGLGLRELPAIGTAVSETAQAAIWDVSERSRWSELIGHRVDVAELCYEPWDTSGALWCRRIDLRFEGHDVSLLLAEGPFDVDCLAPSADNVAVVFGSDVDPPWS